MKRIATRSARRTMAGASMLAAALALPAPAMVMALGSDGQCAGETDAGADENDGANAATCL